MRLTLIVLYILSYLTCHSQRIAVDHLYAIWHLDKYSDEEAYYHPPAKETNDYLDLQPDKTYKAVVEGKAETGRWLYNTNGKYIELAAADGTREKLYIHHLSSRSLVISYDDDQYRMWEVHYVASKRPSR